MSTYRETPAPDPLLLAFGKVLLALHPTKGTLLWQFPLPGQVERLFRIGDRLLLLISKYVLCLDVPSGKQVAGVELPFSATNGLVHEAFVHLAGSGGAACIDLDGRVLWVAAQPAMTETWNFDFSLKCVHGDGSELWKVDPGSTGTPGLCLGNQIAQPDLKS